MANKHARRRAAAFEAAMVPADKIGGECVPGAAADKALPAICRPTGVS
jgi:hypothetical protein